MKCDICGGDTRVLRTETPERRRECERCGHRFTTVEQSKERVERTERILRDAQELATRITEETNG